MTYTEEIKEQPSQHLYNTIFEIPLATFSNMLLNDIYELRPFHNQSDLSFSTSF